MIKSPHVIKILLTLTFLLMVNACNQNRVENNLSTHSIVDDLDNSFHFDAIPQKVITLAPNLTEFIFELEVEELLIGNTTFCNYPEEAKDITNVGDLLTVDYEKIISLKPDLIFITVEGNSKNTYTKLTEYGFRVFVSNPRNYEGIKKTFRDFSKIFQKKDFVENKIKQWDVIVNSIGTSRKNLPSKSSMFLISLKPIMLAGGKTFVNEFLRLCNLKNIASKSDVNYPLFSREEILNQNPEYIINSFMQKNIVDDIHSSYPEWKNLAAVKNNMIITVDPDLFFRPGPRFVIALEKLRRGINNISQNKSDIN